MDGEPADVPVLFLDLADVEPAADLETELPDRVPDRVGAGEGAGRALEDDQEPVAGGLDLVPSLSPEPAPDERVVALEELPPQAVAELGGAHRRADDVGEEDGTERTLDRHGRKRGGRQPLMDPRERS